MKYVLFIVTSAAEISPNHRKTGYFFPEVAHPHHEFTQQGYTVDFATLQGGRPAADGYDANDPLQREFRASKGFARLNNSRRLSEVDASLYDAVFIPGGLGPMVDLAQDPLVKKTVAAVVERGQVLGAVCHGPVALLGAKLSNGKYLVEGKQISAFTDEEEQGYAVADVPFLLEAALREQGASFVEVSPWQPLSVVDGLLVTGQNPASATAVARDMIALLETQPATGTASGYGRQQ
ncbi:type 1 glutamine amidotransferase domain-containing protein [Hymenobacter wooponensis]|uniref:Type 1 glutamine amidotransferase domain-containing protein n=1 Tax=Hymenobacter wooponensis TaxID=1525360 RepID=A0A4Z0MEH3_9BACT|nr:type 1 glutamine amidotransferase domain-containing protein [Hymenobacter wooponensis]TGD77615.1 type 1 glutamine amidotransferase domain-containing protein [Hymenobacter wooponensis]